MKNRYKLLFRTCGLLNRIGSDIIFSSRSQSRAKMMRLHNTALNKSLPPTPPPAPKITHMISSVLIADRFKCVKVLYFSVFYFTVFVAGLVKIPKQVFAPKLFRLLNKKNGLQPSDG
jgi:hypothetical protein